MKSKNDQINDLINWIKHCEGDVDFQVFRNECDNITRSIYMSQYLRIPVGIMGRGIITLDAGCALIKEFVPSELTQYNLPGVKERFRLLNPEPKYCNVDPSVME